MVANVKTSLAREYAGVLGNQVRRRGGMHPLEMLESRTMLSATLFVTAPSVTPDATHFQTLQAALLVALPGDSVVLQMGFSMGSFSSTSLSAPANAGALTMRTAGALEVGEVVSVGSNSGADPLERVLVMAVSATGSGDFLVTLATPLLHAHSGSAVNAGNSATTGPTIGIARGITLTAEAGVVLPFNLEVWHGVAGGATGVTLSNLNVTGDLYIDGDGNTFTNMTVSNQVVLNNAHGNVFSGMHVNGRMTVGAGSSGNTVSGSTLAQVWLASGGHDNSFVGDTVASLVGLGVGDTSGHDLFQNNTFTGAVSITGNTNVATGDSFAGNTFTVATGDALTLEHANGTQVKGNTFADSSGFANAIVVHDSDDMVISGNQITTTGSMGTGVYVYSEGTGSSSVDITGNTVHTGDGFAIYLAKYDTTAAMEVRVQGNDLKSNAVGVFAWGDGVSAGNIDVGGGLTRFGAGTGGNDFSGFLTADAGHYAVGVFGTDEAYVLHADKNVWGVADGLLVVADGTHTPAAFGTGMITAAPIPVVIAPAVETIAATASDLSAVETGTTAGIVASFSSSAAHGAGDFTAMITWGDGTSSMGIVVADGRGGFSVMASHTWSDAGTYGFSVAIADSGASTNVGGTATIAERVIAVQGVSFAIDKKVAFNGAVANFTDNLLGTTTASYVASVAWSDGVTTLATVVKNVDGSFSVKTGRGFTQTGVVVASVSVGTVDGMFFGVASLTATVTNKNDKVPGPKPKTLFQTTTLIKRCLRKEEHCKAVLPRVAALCHRHG